MTFETDLTQLNMEELRNKLGKSEGELIQLNRVEATLGRMLNANRLAKDAEQVVARELKKEILARENKL